MADNGGKFQVAFWVLAVVVTVFMVGIVNAVVANDRIRSQDDDKIRTEIKELLIENSSQHSIIMQDLACIKTTMGIRDGNRTP